MLPSPPAVAASRICPSVTSARSKPSSARGSPGASEPCGAACGDAGIAPRPGVRGRPQVGEIAREQAWLARCSPGNAQEGHHMASLETKPTGSGKEIALLVSVLMLVGAAT